MARRRNTPRELHSPRRASRDASPPDVVPPRDDGPGRGDGRGGRRSAADAGRREGLPTTGRLVESLVGEFNARVKGRQKFWNRPAGAEAILQVRAALLSE